MAPITEIPIWNQEKATKESYAGSEPYAYLYALRSDAFKHEVTLDRMAEEARAFGVRNFKKLYTEYVRTLKQEKGKPDGNVTSFQDQPIELASGRWKADDTGITCDGDLQPIIACTHPIIPVKRLINIDTDTEKIMLWYRPGKIPRTVIADKSQLASPQSIIKLADRGVAITSENAKAMIRFLADIEAMNYDRIDEVRSVSRLGWIPKYGFSPYVDSIEFDGDAQFKAAFEAVGTNGKFEKWASVIDKIRVESMTARIMIAASFASVLVEICGCNPFFVHLWSAESGTGKTVALMAAASVWANPAVGAYIQTFNSTVVGREKMAAFCNSLPLCIDELQLGKDSRGKQHFDVYGLAEGVGRTRGTKTGGIEKTSTWRNCILTTGETPLTSNSAGAGALNRVLDIECKAGEVVVSGGNRVVDALKKNYGHAGKLFISYLESEERKEEAYRLYSDYYLELTATDTTEKQAHAAALILAADELVEKWIFNSPAMMDWQLEKGITAPRTYPLFVDDMRQFLLTKAQVDVNQRAYDWACDWVASNQAHFGAGVTGELYGEISGEYAYIIPSVFRRAVEDQGFSVDGFIGWLKARDLILRGDGSHLYPKRTIGKTRVRCIALKIPEFIDDWPYLVD